MGCGGLEKRGDLRPPWGQEGGALRGDGSAWLWMEGEWEFFAPFVSYDAEDPCGADQGSPRPGGR